MSTGVVPTRKNLTPPVPPPLPPTGPDSNAGGGSPSIDPHEVRGPRGLTALLGSDSASGSLWSLIIHLVVVLILALWTFGEPLVERPLAILTGMAVDDDFELAAGPQMPDAKALVSEQLEFGSIVMTNHDDLLPPIEKSSEATVVVTPGLGSAQSAKQLLAPVGEQHSAGGYEGRSPEGRQKLLEDEGGTEESEQAVLRGLAWIAAHQHQDGGWRFNHHLSPCRGCRHPGTAASTTAATSLALLPFLGAGFTHREGKYEQVVNRGLYHLMNRMRLTAAGGDLQDGTMYGQGLSAIALAEAYAMTRDNELRLVGQAALDFIIHAQDVNGGGWRYNPGQPGDMSMHGWQLMALKSGQLGYMDVSPLALKRASRFLELTQFDGGSRFGYLDPKDGTDATTAIGLLCRMYLGARRDHPGLEKGVEWLAKQGPSAHDMYFNYYATQVMHHWGGKLWQAWNTKLREHLIATQSRTGFEAGSWHFEDKHGEIGGRLYDTALAVMTLEVYYRHLPLYRTTSVAPEF